MRPRPAFPWLASSAPVALAGLLCATSCNCGSTSPAWLHDGGGLGGDGGGGILDINPKNPTLAVKTGTPVPTVRFAVTANGAPVTATFTADHATVGTVSTDGLFTPTGGAAGVANVKAAALGQTVTTTVTVTLDTEQNGASSGPDAGPGAGGWNGVGGEGVGPPVIDPVKTTLGGAPKTDASLGLLYPYDQTVWPLGQLAPLLQWKGSAALLDAASGVLIHLTATGYSYKGFFGRPAPLASGAPFERHPIPQAAWDAATKSAAGGTLKVELTLASGTSAYGPMTETWKISAAPLKGVVYYQSYGTNLAKNYPGALPAPTHLFGGATLAIKPGASDPTLVAGKDGAIAACQVCHSVSADGSRMIVQHGEDYDVSSTYDLKHGYAESGYPASARGAFRFVGLSPDGALGVNTNVDGPFDGQFNAALWDMATGTQIASTGLTGFVTRAGFPAFSPDGKLVAFNFFAGPGGSGIGAGDGSKLVVMSFDRASKAFSSPKTLYTSTTAKPPAWPSFFPTNNAVAFEVVLPGNTTELFATRNGAKGELWWVDMASSTAHALDRANGKGYAPTSGTHPDDSVLNFEPTVCPLPSGGYAWIIFMSRRLYGNVATLDPWWSDPRDHDLTVNPTPKKLWVAALDLNAPAGSDPSHPAFYLPAQEILAGNSRGFWVIEACREDGAACESGDQCCGGYCIDTGGEIGGGVCGGTHTGCANEYDKCAVDADCCNKSFSCVNQRCLDLGPQ